MPLPFLNATEQSIDMITQFGGYNHQLNLSENEFYDMKNMSSRNFPMASTRKKRGLFSNGMLKKANALVSKDSIVYSYTGQGDIGVTLVDSLKDNPWVEPPVVEEDIKEAGITKVAPCYRTDLTDSILGTYRQLNNFDRYIYSNGNMAFESSIKGGMVDADYVWIIWEHEKIPKGTLWAKELFVISHYYTLYKNRASVKNNDFIKKPINRKILKGHKVWVGDRELTVKEIRRRDQWQEMTTSDDWTIIFEEDIDTWIENKPLYVRLTDPIPEDIPEGKFTIKNEEDGTQELINQPSKVKVEAKSDSHVKVLKGQTVVFEDGNGSHECYVSGYEINGKDRYLIIDCPHDAVESGATSSGERLFLCEYNPFTGAATVSDVFTAAQGEHKLVEMGGYVVVFPEKVMINTKKRDKNGAFTDIQPLELSDIYSKCIIKLVDANGNVFDGYEVKNTAPVNPGDNDAWIDTSENPPKLKVYSSELEQWASTQPYCEISLPDDSLDQINDEWQIGDAIELKFDDDTIGKIIVPVIDQKYFVISAVEDANKKKILRFPVSMKTETKENIVENKLVVTRSVPDMDFVIENENRLWGCKYGEVDGEPINEIFACKLGDPKNWHYFANTAMDSYYVSVGADGEFTGAISYAGSPFFFREECIHRIYGNYPANYSLKTIYCHGVEKGSEKGITVMNDVIFYKSPVGIMAYTGASPVHVSKQFGNEIYKNAIACAVGNKMYFSMQDQKGNNVFFSYDDNTKMWFKEDDFRCRNMVVFENDVYALSMDNTLVAMNSEALETSGIMVMEDDFDWFLISGNIGYNTPFYKHVARLNIRMSLERTARASIYIQYNSDGNWYKVTNLESKGKVINMSVPVQPHRCDHFSLKIEGNGEIQIYSITKFVEGGSENE